MKNKKFKLGSFVVAFAIMFSLIFSYTNIIKANEVNVSTLQELKNAIQSNNIVKVISNIEITETINLSSYTGKIYSDNNNIELTLGSGLDAMFISKGGNFEINSLTLNGNQNGRIMDVSGSTINIKNSIVKNATTQNFKPVISDDGFNHQRYQGGAIYADGTTLNIEDTVFVDNHSKNDTPRQIGNGDPISPHGGAIYIGSQTKLNILGGEFRNNYSGSGSPHGEGGAIKAEGGSHININANGTSKTVFDGNHNYRTASSIGGLQGGAIEVTESTVDINNTDFIVKGGFDTGGAIKFQNSGSQDKHNIVRNSTFKLVGGDLPQTPVISTYFGTSGGAIVSENSFLTIDNSDFTMENNPNVTFAGGHIDITGVGEFNLLNSRLKGNAPDWMAWNEVWKYKSAKYGGAIAFENGASVKALIRDTEIKNYMVDHTGGVIAVGHRNGNEYGNTTVDLTIEGTTIHNGQAYTFDNNSAGAGIYITEGSKVVIKNSANSVSTISQMLANYGAAIYNKGELTIDGGTKIINNRAEQMAGGLFNDGYANIHDANFSGNWKQNKWGSKEIHTIGIGNPAVYEKSGENIYAKKDVIVGTKAKFDGKDIRVIDKQSSVILSGPRENVINVSISETEKTGDNTIWEKDFFENVHKYVGYTVGRGLVETDLTATYKPEEISNYVPTVEDAKKFHLVSRTINSDEIADVEDHTSTAKWDYVYNPEDKTVVLGQRAKMVYHTNEANATIEGGVADTDPAGQKLDQIYTFYKSGNGAPKVSINNETVTELTVVDKIPTLEGYTFKSWNTEKLKGNAKLTGNVAEDLYDFAKSTFTNTWHNTNRNAEIRSILSANTENTLHTYAVYDKPLNITVEARKVWNAENKAKVTLQLVRTDKNNEVIEEKEIGENDTEWVAFKPVSKVENGEDITSKYAVIEKGMDNRDIVTLENNKNYLVDYNYENQENLKRVTVTNTELLDISVTKIWDGKDVIHKENVVIELYDGNDKVSAIPLTYNEDPNKSYKGKFENLPKLNKDGQPIEYSVKEKGMNDLKIVTLNNKNYGVEIIEDKNIPNPEENTKYFVVKNTELVDLTVRKVWAGEENVTHTEPVVIEFYGNGQYTGEITLNSENKYTMKVLNLTKFDKNNGEKIVYSVKEKSVDNQDVNDQGVVRVGNKDYTVLVSGDIDSGFTVTNTYKEPTPIVPILPSTIDIDVTKEWVGEVKEKSVKVVLYANGEKTDKFITLDETNNWTSKFEGVKTVKNVADKEAILYTVKEVGEENNILEVKGNKYSVEYSGSVEKGFVIKNTYKKPTPMVPILPSTIDIDVTKEWVGEVKEKSVDVVLYANGKDTKQVITLNEENSWKGKFVGVKTVENVADKEAILYTVKEVGEKNNILEVNGNKYSVEYSGSVETGFVIKNTYKKPTPIVPTPIDPTPIIPTPIIPTPQPEPNKPIVEEVKPNKPNKTPETRPSGKVLPKTSVASTSIATAIMSLAGVVLFKRKRK